MEFETDKCESCQCKNCDHNVNTGWQACYSCRDCSNGDNYTEECKLK